MIFQNNLPQTQSVTIERTKSQASRDKIPTMLAHRNGETVFTGDAVQHFGLNQGDFAIIATGIVTGAASVTIPRQALPGNGWDPGHPLHRLSPCRTDEDGFEDWHDEAELLLVKSCFIERPSTKLPREGNPNSENLKPWPGRAPAALPDPERLRV